MIASSAYEFTGPTHARGTDYFELTALVQCTVILAGNTRASRDAAEAQKLARSRLRTYPETQNTLENIILNTRSDSRGLEFQARLTRPYVITNCLGGFLGAPDTGLKL